MGPPHCLRSARPEGRRLRRTLTTDVRGGVPLTLGGRSGYLLFGWRQNVVSIWWGGTFHMRCPFFEELRSPLCGFAALPGVGFPCCTATSKFCPCVVVNYIYTEVAGNTSSNLSVILWMIWLELVIIFSLLTWIASLWVTLLSRTWCMARRSARTLAVHIGKAMRSSSRPKRSRPRRSLSPSATDTWKRGTGRLLRLPTIAAEEL